ncbi:MAG: DUF2914 domain-containing protein [Aquificota bacterium]|nr:MAG: DUF2914 domain-containing protein [Aquificota bacterium]
MALKIFSILLAIFAFINISKAEEDSLIEVLDMKVAEKIINREPVDVSDTFPKDIKKVYCWTKIRAFKVPTFILHEWYYKDRKIASVKLKITYPVFRTWSSKRIIESWTGKWRVVVKDENGSIIADKEFYIK